MVVGVGVVELYLHGNRSLKGKRGVVKSVIAKIKNEFNASVAETGKNDVHEHAQIGFCLMGNDRAVINSKLDKIVNMVENMGLAELLNYDFEVMVL